MKILMVSTDESIIREGSEAYLRMREYGNLFSELHIILFSKKKGTERRIRENVFVYPVYSICRFFVPFKAFFKYGRVIEEEGSDWRITTQDPFETGIVGFLMKTFSGIFWQAQIHTDFLSPFFFRQSFLNKIRVFAAKLIIWKADRIRVVSERIKKSLVEIGLEGKKIDVLPISIKAEEIENIPISFNLKEKYPGMDFIILMVSRITPEKNIRSAVAAFFEALKKRPKMKLVIAGEGPSLPDLKRETEKRGILKDVEFLGELTHEKAISAMKTADLFLSSSVYEGYGMTAVEAAAAGCPVLITDTGIAGEIIKDGESGTVVPVGSVLKMAEAIEVLAGNKEKREKMAERAKESVKNLMSKDEYLNKFKEILEK